MSSDSANGGVVSSPRTAMQLFKETITDFSGRDFDGHASRQWVGLPDDRKKYFEQLAIQELNEFNRKANQITSPGSTRPGAAGPSGIVQNKIAKKRKYPAKPIRPKSDNWEAAKDANGKTYYFNPGTKEYSRTQVFSEAEWNKKVASVPATKKFTNAYAIFLNACTSVKGVQAKADLWGKMSADERQIYEDIARTENVSRATVAGGPNGPKGATPP